MRSTTPLLVVAAVSMAGCGLAGTSTGGVQARAGEDAVFEGPVPRAGCGPGSRPEEGLQGMGPGEGEDPYICNMELVGQEGNGASWQMATYGDCAYYGTNFDSGAGTIVVDVSDSANPQRTANLITPAMAYPHESLAANERRGLLAGVSGLQEPFFDVYDVSRDCAQPALEASLPVSTMGHEGDWAPDGNTYYGTGIGSWTAIDVTDPALPRQLFSTVSITHGLSVSDDGNRMYKTQLGPLAPNGLDIVDVSQIQSRAPVPQVTTISSLYWTDGSAAQATIPVTIKGKPYVIFFDEGGYGGAPPGAARIIDISDEANPFIVSKLKLEVHLTEIANGVGNLNAHYCGVPQRNEPGIVGCSYTTSGLRVFDIRDPYHPKEIAYYEPYMTPNGMSARVHFDEERGEVWTTNQNTGFFVVRFTNGVWPFKD